MYPYWYHQNVGISASAYWEIVHILGILLLVMKGV